MRWRLALRLNELKSLNPQLAEVLPAAVEGVVDERLTLGQLTAAADPWTSWRRCCRTIRRRPN
ncbi:MAG: hypothetical protein QM775_27565 [Pirellulales bacterium]